MILYFVAYRYVRKSGNAGYGHGVVGVSRKIKDDKTLSQLVTAIHAGNNMKSDPYQSIVILNFKRL